MKKLYSFLLSLCMVMILTACGSDNSSSGQSVVSSSVPSSTAPSSTPEQAFSESTASSVSEPASSATQESSVHTNADDSDDSKTLVVYFSMPETTETTGLTQEEDNSVVVVNGEALGNTQHVAYVIQENTGADIFRIQPVTAYPTDHETLVNLASGEQAEDARPAIAETIENPDQYDTVFIGYPNWWGDMPMILYTFFDTYDLSGKTIIPFNTHGGSGFSNTISTIADLEPGAAVEENGFTISRNNMDEAEASVISWLEDLGFESMAS